MDSGNKDDRRVRKTKKALREGLVELLNQKSIQSITVRELTDKVDIHRSTFYANFKDVYELYSHMEDTIIQEISDIVSVDCTFKPDIFFNGLLDYVNRNREISRLFFGGNISASFFERITDMFKNACTDYWCKEYNVTNISDEMDYYVQFSLSGSLGVVGLWVSRDFEHPVETLVTMLANIDCNMGEMFRSKFS